MRRDFNERNHTEAIFYYEKGIPTSDPKIFFNLSASYFAQQNLNKAILYIQRCLKINPNYPNAKKIYQRLLKLSESTK